MNRSLVLHPNEYVYLLDNSIDTRDAILRTEFLDRVVPDLINGGPKRIREFLTIRDKSRVPLS